MTSFGLLSSKDAAELLGKTTQWVQVNRKRLGLPHYKIGGRYYFKAAELESWLEAQHSEGQTVAQRPDPSNRFKLAI